MAGKISELDQITGAALTLTDDIEVRDIDDPEMSPLTGTNKGLQLGELILFLQTHMADAGLVVDDVPPADTSVLWADTTEQGWASNTVLAGTVAPTSGDGNDGDFWINTTTWMIYGPRDDAVWPTGVSMTGGGGGGGLDQATADTLYLSKTGDDVPTADYIVRSITAWGSVGAESVFEHLGCDTIFVNDSLQLYTPIYLDGTANVPTDPRHATSKGYVDGLLANKQPLDGDLTAIAGLAATGLITRTATDAAARSIAGTTNKIVVTNGDGVAGNPTLTVGTDIVQLTGSQTLSGKTVSMGNNTISGTSSEFNLANLDADFYTTGGTDVAVADGGTGRSTATTAYGLIAAGTTATGAQQTVTPAASGFLKTTSTTALPAWAAIASGDVSGLGSLATLSTVGAAQITDGVVSNTELSTMPASTIKGNNTGSTAAPIDMTVAQAKTLLALVKGDVGLANVDNTSDANKPVSTAQQTALNLKVDKTSLTVASTAPSSPAVNDLWVDTT